MTDTPDLTPEEMLAAIEKGGHGYEQAVINEIRKQFLEQTSKEKTHD